MEDCFKVKLKGSVNNDKIDKLGEITFSMVPHETNTYLLVGAIENDACVIKTADGTNFYNKSKNEVSIPTNAITFDRTTKGLVIITNKYKLSVIAYGTAGLSSRNTEYDKPISEFNYLTNLTSLGVGVYGNLEDLKLYGLTALTCQFCPELYGDINYLVNFILLNEVILTKCTNITGKVEDYVAGNVFRNNIITKEFSRFRCNNTQVTWLDAPITNSSGLSWSPNSINNNYIDITYLNSTTTIVVNNDGTWNYVNSDKSQYLG